MRSKFNITIPLDESMFEEPVMQILRSVMRDVAKEEALNAVKEAFTPMLEQCVKSSVTSLVRQATYSNGEMSDKIKNIVAQTMNDVCFENTIKSHVKNYTKEWERTAKEKEAQIEAKINGESDERLKLILVPIIRNVVKEMFKGF